MPRDTRTAATQLAAAHRNPNTTEAELTAASLAYNMANIARLREGEAPIQEEAGPISAEQLNRMQALRDDVRRKHQDAVESGRVMFNNFYRLEYLLDEGDELQSALARLTQERDAAEEALSRHRMQTADALRDMYGKALEAETRFDGLPSEEIERAARALDIDLTP
ncbi:hypothetical protein [Hymenobacter koreensis]|uniref:Uncharacterized protein n=1 Tax=Hymenobacter koreensis TaxID=1084523 RepID=A0ABP8JNC9_9BACT